MVTAQKVLLPEAQASSNRIDKLHWATSRSQIP